MPEKPSDGSSRLRAADDQPAAASTPNAPAACGQQAGSSQEGEGESAVDARTIEQLTLSELLDQLLRAPRPTWKRLRIALNYGAGDSRSAGDMPSAAPGPATATAAISDQTMTAGRALPQALRSADAVQLLLCGAAIMFALVGSVIVRGSESAPRANEYSLSLGAPYLWLGFLLWIAAEVAGRWTRLAHGWRALAGQSRMRWLLRTLPLLIAMYAFLTLMSAMTAAPERATDIALASLAAFAAAGSLWIAIDIVHWRFQRRMPARDAGPPLILARAPIRRPVMGQISRWRMLLVALASLSSVGVWLNTSGNRIEPPIILLWLLSAALWGFAFAPLRWNLFDWASGRLDVMRRIPWRDQRATIIALALIMLLGAAFRLNKLDAYPPQMYSDLVEKIQDAYKIHHQDDYRIYFSNIGGREPLHFYLLSMLASQPGLGFDHYALKLMSALESLITLPIIFWLGVEIAGRRRRELGILLGGLAAALAAASFWHAVIGRQGMRISLSPLFSALTALCLARALRHNRRADFVLAGLALGFGLSGYQAVRMLPLAAVAGVAVAAVLVKQDWRARLSYALNLVVLAFVALMVFLPLLHFWLEEPADYMRRADTRVFGDAPTTDAERAAFLAESAPVLLSNIRKTALMFHFFGATTWVSGLSDEPAMDAVTAAFMLLGIPAWLALIAKTRDPVYAFVPLYLVATLLPTTLALSFPNEVPSFIRASGAIPPSYLVAALPIALFCLQLRKTLPPRMGTLVAALLAAGIALAANHYNASLYFGRFTDNFVQSSHPQAQAGKILRGFAQSGGAYGNAFVLTSPHWWDYRAVGIEAGMMFWDSGGDVQSLPAMLGRGLWREQKYRLDPERDLLFFYARQNAAAPALLAEWFPQGRPTLIEVEPAHKSFYIYRAPALGAKNLARFLAENP